jgi:class 3 adenylate cyclase
MLRRRSASGPRADLQHESETGHKTAVLEGLLTDARVERRLAAILAADVVGFSALMERDEEGTYARIGSLRREVIEPRLSQHQGRLIKTTGDGFLAEFASPIAALGCALAIQDSSSNTPDALRLRIGLNLGDVIIESGGDVYGEGVNVAARLEALADADGILISDKIHREVEGKVEAAFEDRGEQQVKNITRPVRIYAVRPVGTASSSAATIQSQLDPGKPLPLPDRPSIAACHSRICRPIPSRNISPTAWSRTSSRRLAASAMTVYGPVFLLKGVSMHPVKLRFPQVLARIRKLLQNKHNAEALVTSMFTFEKLMKRSLRRAIVARGFTLAHADILLDGKGFEDLRSMWEVFEKDHKRLPAILGAA